MLCTWCARPNTGWKASVSVFWKVAKNYTQQPFTKIENWRKRVPPTYFSTSTAAVHICPVKFCGDGSADLHSSLSFFCCKSTEYAIFQNVSEFSSKLPLCYKEFETFKDWLKLSIQLSDEVKAFKGGLCQDLDQRAACLQIELARTRTKTEGIEDEGGCACEWWQR